MKQLSFFGINQPIPVFHSNDSWQPAFLLQSSRHADQLAICEVDAPFWDDLITTMHVYMLVT